MAPSSRTCVPWGFGRLRMLQWMWAPDKGVPQSPQLQDVCEWVVGVSVAGFMFVNYCKLLMVSSQGRAGLQASCPKLPKQNYVFPCVLIQIHLWIWTVGGQWRSWTTQFSKIWLPHWGSCLRWKTHWDWSLVAFSLEGCHVTRNLSHTPY